jgi:hypothetical protein
MKVVSLPELAHELQHRLSGDDVCFEVVNCKSLTQCTRLSNTTGKRLTRNMMDVDRQSGTCALQGRNLPVRLSQAGIAELAATSRLIRKRHLADTTAQVVSRTFSQGTVEGIVFPDDDHEYFVESHLQNRGISYDRRMLVSKKHRPHVLGALRQLNQVVDDAAFVFVVEKSDLKAV